jgi:hypothetical protein
MSLLIQHLLVLLLVGASAVWVSWQAFATFKRAKGGFGACCSKGCDAHRPPQNDSSKRVVFIPVEMLRDSARKSSAK